jgi:hypothetical protein
MSDSIEQQAQRQIDELMELFGPEECTPSPELAQAEALIALIRALLADLARVKQERETFREYSVKDMASAETYREHYLATKARAEAAEASLAAVRAALGEIEQEWRGFVERTRRAERNLPEIMRDTASRMRGLADATEECADRLAVLRLGTGEVDG